MNTQEAYVSFQTALLLRDKGFNVPTHTYYTEKGQTLGFIGEAKNWNKTTLISRPTHQLALAYMRDTFGLFICIMQGKQGKSNPYYYATFLPVEGGYEEYLMPAMSFTQEETTEKAIQYILKEVIK